MYYSYHHGRQNIGPNSAVWTIISKAIQNLKICGMTKMEFVNEKRITYISHYKKIDRTNRVDNRS